MATRETWYYWVRLRDGDADWVIAEWGSPMWGDADGEIKRWLIPGRRGDFEDPDLAEIDERRITREERDAPKRSG